MCGQNSVVVPKAQPRGCGAQEALVMHPHCDNKQNGQLWLCSFCLDTKKNQKNQEPNMLPARNAGPPPHLAQAIAPARN